MLCGLILAGHTARPLTWYCDSQTTINIYRKLGSMNESQWLEIGNTDIWRSVALIKKAHGRRFSLKKIKAHETMIRQLQFDATRIVSCGNDGTAVIIDITNGEVSQSLRGHEKAVVSVCFDTIKILTASSDNTLRLWKWGTAGDALQDKLHVWEPGDTLPKVAVKYDLSVRDLVKWNAIRTAAALYPGGRLGGHG